MSALLTIKTNPRNTISPLFKLTKSKVWISNKLKNKGNIQRCLIFLNQQGPKGQNLFQIAHFPPQDKL